MGVKASSSAGGRRGENVYPFSARVNSIFCNPRTFSLALAKTSEHHPGMISNPLKRWMDRTGVQAKDVAVRIGVSEPAMSRLLRGKTQADPETLAKISAVTGCTVTPNDWVAWVTESKRVSMPPRKVRKKSTA